jgi:hypothetical protein
MGGDADDLARQEDEYFERLQKESTGARPSYGGSRVHCLSLLVD